MQELVCQIMEYRCNKRILLFCTCTSEKRLYFLSPSPFFVSVIFSCQANIVVVYETMRPYTNTLHQLCATCKSAVSCLNVLVDDDKTEP